MYKSVSKAIADCPAEPAWQVTLAPGVAKTLLGKPQIFYDLFDALRAELAEEGPIQSEWPHYNSEPVRTKDAAGEYTHHCYLRCGYATYVVWWVTMGKTIRVTVV